MSAHVNITAIVTEVRAEHVWTNSVGVTHGSWRCSNAQDAQVARCR